MYSTTLAQSSLLRVIKPDNPSVFLSPRSLRRVDAAIDYIHQHYASHISAEQLSLHVNLSVLRLQEGLKKQTGMTLYKYQEQVRIRSARELLSDTNLSIRLIADKVGFKTHSHFGKVFKQSTGMTPHEYRDQHGR